MTSILCIFTVRNEVAKVMFLHLSVFPHASVHAGIPPPDQTPLGADPPLADTPPGADLPPPPSRRLLLRTVRILLECILVN